MYQNRVCLHDVEMRNRPQLVKWHVARSASASGLCKTRPVWQCRPPLAAVRNLVTSGEPTRYSAKNLEELAALAGPQAPRTPRPQPSPPDAAPGADGLPMPPHGLPKASPAGVLAALIGVAFCTPYGHPTLLARRPSRPGRLAAPKCYQDRDPGYLNRNENDQQPSVVAAAPWSPPIREG